VTDKVLRHGEALGGISRITFMMNASSLSHPNLMRAIDLLGSDVAPVLRKDPALRPA
jgi:hypothetical protein